MCKVYEFPVKADLPEDVKIMLEKNAKDYINSVNETLEYLDSLCEHSDMYDEIMELVCKFMEQAMIQAVNDIL